MARPKNSERGEDLMKLESAIAENLIDLKQEKNKSFREMGEICGVSSQQFSKYIHGKDKISAGRLAMVAKYFKISIGQLFRERK